MYKLFGYVNPPSYKVVRVPCDISTSTSVNMRENSEDSLRVIGYREGRPRIYHTPFTL